MHLMFFSIKEGRPDVIELELLNDGWLMKHECYHGKVGPCGNPHLYRGIRENYSSYPPAFPDAMEEIWNAAHYDRLPEFDVQARLDRFSAWIQAYVQDNTIDLMDALGVERNSPPKNRPLC